MHANPTPGNLHSADAPAEEWLTSVQAIKHLNISSAFFRKAVDLGLLPAVNIGLGTKRREFRVRKSDLDRFMSERAMPSPSSHAVSRHEERS